MTFLDIHPAYVINGYLWDELKKFEYKVPKAERKLSKYKHMPFYPINDSNATPSNKPYFIYNFAFRVMHGFHAIKKSTFIYSLKAEEEDMLDWGAALQMIIDRQDDAAMDINEWNRAHDNAPFSFHSFRLYQNEPSVPRDSSASSAMSVVTFMVVAEYHYTYELSDMHKDRDEWLAAHPEYA